VDKAYGAGQEGMRHLSRYRIEGSYADENWITETKEN